jgi:cytochrome c-type biogenesis protein CcmI
MTLLWMAGGLLALLSVLLLVQPLVRRRREAAPREAHDAAVLADQLSEVDRDEASGLIDATAAAAARRELKRRLLGTMEQAQRAADAPAASAGTHRKWLAGALALAVPALAAVVYLQLGNPATPDQPLVARQASGDLAEANQEPAAATDPSLAETIGELERYLAGHPNEGQGWYILGRAYLAQQRTADAVAALQKARPLLADRPDVAAALGEALVMAAGGQITPEAQQQFADALAADPRNIQARYYLALGRAQRGDVKGAVQDWVDLLALSPADAPWLGLVRQQIAAAAHATGIDPATLKPSAAALALVPADVGPPATAAIPGPNADDMKAAAEMSPEQRQQMIRSMVERLATRLKDNPDDRQGWLRLARAYDVLGETAKAADARARAEAATK